MILKDFFRHCAQLSVPYRYALTSVLLLVTSYVWFHYAYEPLQKKIVGYQKKVTSVAHCAAQLPHMRSACLGMEKQVKELQSTVSSHQFDQNAKMQALFNLIHNAQLRLTHFQYESAETKKGYLKYPIRLEIRGTFDQTLTFFNTLNQSQLGLQCTNLVMNRQPDGAYNAQCVLHFIRFNKA